MSRAVLAFFPSSQAALEAADELRHAGFHPDQVDQIHRYPGDGTQRLMNPLTGRFGSLAELSLGAELDDSEQSGPLLAADPSASGLSAPDGLPGDKGFMVTILVEDDDEADRAAKMVEDLGGYV